MRGFVCTAILFFAGLLWGVELPDLPKTPVSPLEKERVDAAFAADSPDGQDSWSAVASDAKKRALEFALKDNVNAAADWYYASLAADFFANGGAEMPKELKRAILDDLPAFFDFYETAPRNSLGNAAPVLSTIFLNQPAQAKKYLRAAMALSLVYANPLPGAWPAFEVPDEPTQVSQPQEIFLYLSLRADKMPFDMSKLTVGELVFSTGIAGPLTELEGIADDRFEPSKMESSALSVKLDASRVRGAHVAKWNDERAPFTLENLAKYGGSQHERLYYAFRKANANGVPCVLYTVDIKRVPYSWIDYMEAPMKWRTDVLRDPKTKNAHAVVLHQLTWKPLSSFDFHRVKIRANTEESTHNSIVLSRLAQLLFDAGENKKAEDFAKRALELDALNPVAHSLMISASARAGADSKTIDALFRESVEAFAAYPEQCAKMAREYRGNLIMRKRFAQADAVFNAVLKPVFRKNPELAVVLYSDVIVDMVDRAETHTQKMAVYSSVLRAANKAPTEAFTYITVPVVQYFKKRGDKKDAEKALKAIESNLLKNGSARAVADFRELKEELEEDGKAEKSSASAHRKSKHKTGGNSADF